MKEVLNKRERAKIRILKRRRKIKDKKEFRVITGKVAEE